MRTTVNKELKNVNRFLCNHVSYKRFDDGEIVDDCLLTSLIERGMPLGGCQPGNNVDDHLSDHNGQTDGEPHESWIGAEKGEVVDRSSVRFGHQEYEGVVHKGNGEVHVSLSRRENADVANGYVRHLNR